MMLLAVAPLWFFLRLRLYRCKVTAPSFVIGLVVLYCGFLFTYNPEYSQLSGIAPFCGLKALVGFTWWSYYWLFCYAWTLLFVMLRLREEGATTLADVWAAFRERKLLDVEFVLIIAVLGSVPEILLSDYSSTHYFADGSTVARSRVDAWPSSCDRALRRTAIRGAAAETAAHRAQIRADGTAAGGRLAGPDHDSPGCSPLSWVLFVVGTFVLNTECF